MRLMNLLVFVLLACLLVVPGSYVLLTLVLAAAGMASFKSIQTTWSQAWHIQPVRWIAVGTALYVLIGLFLGWWYGYTGGYYDAFVPFILAPFVLHGIVRNRLNPIVFWLGSAAGAITAGLYASYQSLILNIGRAIGSLNNQIMFGDLSVLLACISLLGLLYCDKAQSRRWIQSVLVLGALFGVWASLLSGSKGGWLSIVTVGLVFGWQATSNISFQRRFAAVLGIALVLLAGFALAPADLVFNRIASGLSGAIHWFSTGEIKEESASIRLEFWWYGLQLFIEKPLLGWSNSGAYYMLSQHMQGFGYPASFDPVFENDLIHFAATAGLVGLTGIAALFFGIFRGFWYLGKLPDPVVKGLALMGMLLVILFVEFGLSVNVLSRNAFRHVFSTFAATLIGLSLLQLQPDKKGI